MNIAQTRLDPTKQIDLRADVIVHLQAAPPAAPGQPWAYPDPCSCLNHNHAIVAYRILHSFGWKELKAYST